jgi:ATP-dependent RNA helicase RhlE
VHRIGRTGRAGAKGEAVSLVCVDEHAMLRDIERLIKQTLPREVIAGFEPDPNAKAQPIQLRSGTGHHQNRPPRQGGGGNGNGNGGGNRSQNSQGKPRVAANGNAGAARGPAPAGVRRDARPGGSPAGGARPANAPRQRTR